MHLRTFRPTKRREKQSCRFRRKWNIYNRNEEKEIRCDELVDDQSVRFSTISSIYKNCDLYVYIYIVRGISIVVGGTSERTISSDITWKVFRSSMPHVQNAGNIWMVHRGRCPSVQSISVFNLRMVGWLLGNVYYWTASPEFGRRKSILSILNANNFDIVAWTYLCT